MSFEKCDTCRGTGKVECPRCSGFPWVNGKIFVGIGGDDGCWDTCPRCDGDEDVDCPECMGRGDIWESDDD